MDDGVDENAVGRAAVENKKVESSESFSPPAAPSPPPSPPPNDVYVTNDQEPVHFSPTRSFLYALELENELRKNESMDNKRKGVETQDEPNANGDAEATDATEPEQPGLGENGEAYEEFIEVTRSPSPISQPEMAEMKAEVEQEHQLVDVSATKQVEPAILGREKDFVESASEIEETKPHELAGNLGTDIGANASTDLEMTDPKDEPMHADESNRHIIKEDNRGNEEKSSGGEQTSEAAEPHPAAARVEIPPLSTDQLKDCVPQTNEVTLLLDREILFDDSIINIPAFDDGSVEARQKLQGWTNQQWIAASDKVLSFTAPVLRVMPGRYFWSSDVYKKRILAIYSNPDIILILRLPTDKDEVRRLLPIQGSLELSEQELHAFLVVESAADPKTCKLQLSQLTNTTSVPGQGQRSSPSKKNFPRRRSCFDILSPTDVATLSAAFLPDDSFDDIEYTNEKALNDTLRCEDAIVSALIDAHSLSIGLNSGTMHIQHQVVLGTLHSNVISGNDQTLKDSLENALQIQMSQSEDESESDGIVDCTIIDARDDSGTTALHYACSRRRNTTVQILLSAGASCSVPQTDDELTPCHICAKNLDEKSLSIVLSASYPTRPNPNALDCHGRTPMYLAAVEGKSDDGNSNAIALDLCLSALDAWGGQLILDSPESKKDLLHPVHCVSAQWKSAELSVLFSHCNYHYPLASIDGSDPGISLSALFHYPIHAALVSLRRRIISAFTEKAGNEFSAEFMPLEPALVKTLRTLLEHGFEPNERFEGIIGQGEAIKTLSSYWGCTPLQILALAAAEARAIDLKKQESGEDDVETMRILKNIMKVIQASAEILVKNGARINVQPPPPTRLDRDTPTGCYSLNEALEDQKVSSMQIGHREGLKLDGNNEVLALLGGAGRVSTCQNAFAAMGKTVKITGDITVGSSSLDSDAPGGSDSWSCSICWSEFGVIVNRKHLCRVSCRNVCNECSAKRLVKNGSEHRVSDGQFLLGRAEAGKADAKFQSGREEQMHKQRQSVTQARKSLGLKSTGGSASSTDIEAKQTKLSKKEKITNAISALGQTRNAVLERGDKLQSLEDKTDALNQASLDFASMAKELNQSQNSWW